MLSVEHCVECGGAFNPDSMVKIQQAWVCGHCKDLVFQQFREGMDLADYSRFAGFWIRLAAMVIDGLILGGINGIVEAVVWATFSMNDNKSALVTFQWVFFYTASALLALSYETFFVGKLGGTPGKLAFWLRVIKANGENLTYGGALLRYLGKIVSSFTLNVGYLMIAFTKEKQGLHDMMCNTRVVWKG